MQISPWHGPTGGRIVQCLGCAALAAALVSGCGGGGGSGRNAPPALAATAFSGAEDAEISGRISATDPEGEPVTLTRTSEPASGTLTSFSPDGSFTYRPNQDFSGTDSFGVRASDTAGGSVDGTVVLTVTPVNDPPVAVNDVLRADGAALARIDLLANDRDADGDALTVTIEEPALVGTAVVGADGTVSLQGLPGGFRGLTRFRYRIADPSGESAVATAAVFVGTDPFRVVFAGEEASGAPEIYMTDFVSPAWRLTAATEGSLRLRGFAVSTSGATVVYRREAQGTGNTDLTFVRTADTTQQVRIPLPNGHTVAPDAAGLDQYVVSADGKWIAVVTRTTGPAVRYAVRVLDVDAPAALRTVSRPDTIAAERPRFSADSRHLYFLASRGPERGGKALYRVALDAPGEAVRLSAAGSLADDIVAYSVSPDETRIALQAIRAGRTVLLFVDPALPGEEVQMNHALAPDEVIVGSTVGLPAELGGSPGAERVAYTVLRAALVANAHVAEVSAVPNPRLVAHTGARAVAFRQDGAALLYSRFALAIPSGQQLFEATIDSGQAHELIGAGASGLYDGTGEVVFVQQVAGGAPILAAATRGAFGSPQRLGTPGRAAWFAGLSGAPRAVALIGEGPESGPRPSSARIALVNAWAPERLLYLADFPTPLSLPVEVARIVTY